MFCPLYRGTLGFGDAFAAANVNKQGLLDGHGGGDLARRGSAEHLVATKALRMHGYGLDSSLPLRGLQNFDRATS